MVAALTEPVVHIVDDDPGVRDSLGLLLGLHGLRVQLFADAEGFLAALDRQRVDCALIDMRMPGVGGLELQRILRQRHPDMPAIIMTAHANVAAARTAFKSGAVDFLTKPIPEAELLEAVREAIAMAERCTKSGLAAGRTDELAGRLSGRERETLTLLAEGLSSREIAAQLGISHRTVETYKSRSMQKLNARRRADLIRFGATALLPQGES